MTPAKPPWGAEPLRWAREAGAVLVRELRGEWRTRVALSGTVLFAVASLTLIGLSFHVQGGAGVIDAPVVAALLWMLTLFTAATGLGRVWVQEEERGTALALRLSARATVVWSGKFGANLLLLWGLTALAAPILLGLGDSANAARANHALLFCVLTVGDIGVAAVFTTTGALVAQASAKGGLLAALSFPLLMPLLLAGVHGTLAALGAGVPAGKAIPFAPGAGDLQVLASFAVVATVASLLLIDFVWND